MAAKSQLTPEAYERQLAGIKQHTWDKSENPLDTTLTIRLGTSLKSRLRSLPDWQDKMRAMMEELVKQESDRQETNAA